MILLFRAFIDEVAHRGVKGLAELVAPQLGKAVDFFQGVLDKYKKRKGFQKDREEAEKIARMTAAQVAEDIREYAKQHLPDDRLREQTEIYLSLAPGAMRRSLRRKDDPKGLSAPADFALNTADQLAAAFPAAVPTLRPNDAVPGRAKYRLIEPVGGGGFGEVWKVADTLRPNHFTALKVFPDPGVRLEVIRHELTQALRLNHPKDGWPAGVVPVVDFQLDGEHPWIMYEFVGGGTLADLVVQWQTLEMPERVNRTLTALKSMAETCAHLHALRPALVHRDLKPANVLRDAVTKTLKITDLGLGGAAVAFEIDTEKSVGQRASVAGRLPSMLHGSYSLNYASPQQRNGQAPDPRDDIHALGVIAYQILTGKLDAAPGVRFERELQALTVPKPLIDLIGDCADAEVGSRPRDGRALVEALGRVSAPPKQEPPVILTAVPKPVVEDYRRPAPQPRPPVRKPEPHPSPTPRRRERSGWHSTIVATFCLIAVGVTASLYFGLGGKRPSEGRRIEWAELQPGTKPGEEITLPLGDSGVTMPFCWCPPGKFERGSNDDDGSDNEKPVKEITISKGFWMAKTETTQAQWKGLGFVNESIFKGDDLPMENVSHTRAVAYADKLKQLTGQAIQLPTEAQWEYACRAGTTTKYHNGDTETDLAAVGWYEANSGSMTHPVGQKKANAWNLHDMHGNVREWCSDWYDAGFYGRSPATDPECRDGKQKLRVLRGGSWNSHARLCRAAYRDYFAPDYRDFNYGFRVCVALD